MALGQSHAHQSLAKTQFCGDYLSAIRSQKSQARRCTLRFCNHATMTEPKKRTCSLIVINDATVNKARAYLHSCHSGWDKKMFYKHATVIEPGTCRQLVCNDATVMEPRTCSLLVCNQVTVIAASKQAYLPSSRSAMRQLSNASGNCASEATYTAMHSVLPTSSAVACQKCMPGCNAVESACQDTVHSECVTRCSAIEQMPKCNAANAQQS